MIAEQKGTAIIEFASIENNTGYCFQQVHFRLKDFIFNINP